VRAKKRPKLQFEELLQDVVIVFRGPCAEVCRSLHVDTPHPGALKLRTLYYRASFLTLCPTGSD
jgi:hypothetical protein